MNALAVKHPGSLALRRLQAGEAMAGEVGEHVAACAECQAALQRFAEEQQQFEQEISFDRFAAGVERAARQQVKPAPRRQWPTVVLALAATVVVIAGVQLVLSRVEPVDGGNRLKGGAAIELKVAGAGPQRDASNDPSVPEALAPGERVRLGITPNEWTYALVVSIDDAAEITPIDVEDGRGVVIGPRKTVAWLPESLEFTGKGLEHVVVVLSAEPIAFEKVADALKLSFRDARGDLTKLGSLPLPGEQFHRTFLKP